MGPCTDNVNTTATRLIAKPYTPALLHVSREARATVKLPGGYRINWASDDQHEKEMYVSFSQDHFMAARYFGRFDLNPYDVFPRTLCPSI